MANREKLREIVQSGDIDSEYGLLRQGLAELGLTIEESGRPLTATQDIVGATIAKFFQQSALIHGGPDILPSEFMRRNPDVYRRIMDEPVDWSFARDVSFENNGSTVKLGDVTPEAFKNRTVGDSMRWLVSNVMGGVLAPGQTLDKMAGVSTMESFMTGVTGAIANIPNYRAGIGGFANFFISTAENTNRAWRRGEAELLKNVTSISSSPTLEDGTTLAEHGSAFFDGESPDELVMPHAPYELIGKGANRAWQPVEGIENKMLAVQFGNANRWGNYTTMSEMDENASTVVFDSPMTGTPLGEAGVKEGDFIPGLGDLLHNPRFEQDLADIDDQLWSGGSVRMAVGSMVDGNPELRMVELQGDVRPRRVFEPAGDKYDYIRRIANRIDPAYGLNVSGVRNDVPESTSSSFSVPTNLYTSDPKARGGMIKNGNGWRIGSFSLGPTKENQYQVQLTARTMNAFADTMPEYKQLLNKKMFAESPNGLELDRNINLLNDAINHISEVTFGRNDRSVVSGEDSIGAFESWVASRERVPNHGVNGPLSRLQLQRAAALAKETGINIDTEQLMGVALTSDEPTPARFAPTKSLSPMIPNRPVGTGLRDPYLSHKLHGKEAIQGVMNDWAENPPTLAQARANFSNRPWNVEHTGEFFLDEWTSRVSPPIMVAHHEDGGPIAPAMNYAFHEGDGSYPVIARDAENMPFVVGSADLQPVGSDSRFSHIPYSGGSGSTYHQIPTNRDPRIVGRVLDREVNIPLAPSRLVDAAPGGPSDPGAAQVTMSAYTHLSNLNASSIDFEDRPVEYDSVFDGGDVDADTYGLGLQDGSKYKVVNGKLYQFTQDGDLVPALFPSGPSRVPFSIDQANRGNPLSLMDKPERFDSSVEDASDAVSFARSNLNYEDAISLVDGSGLMQRAGNSLAAGKEIDWKKLDTPEGSAISKAAAAALADGQTGFHAKNKQRELYTEALLQAGRRDLVARATMVGKDQWGFSRDLAMVADEHGARLPDGRMMRYAPGKEAQFFDDFDALSISNREAANAIAGLFPEQSSQLRALEYLAKKEIDPSYIGTARRELSRRETIRSRAARDQELTMDFSTELRDLTRTPEPKKDVFSINIDQEARRASVEDIRSSVDLDAIKAKARTMRPDRAASSGEPVEAHRQYGHGSNAKYSQRQIGEMRRGRGMFDPETGMINENTPMPAHTFARGGGSGSSGPVDPSEPPEMDPGYWDSIMGAGGGGEEPPDEPPDLYASADPTPEPKRSSGSKSKRAPSENGEDPHFDAPSKKSSIDTSPRMGPPPPGFVSYRDNQLQIKAHQEKRIAELRASGGDLGGLPRAVEDIDKILAELDDPNSAESRIAAKRDAINWDMAEAEATGQSTTTSTPSSKRNGSASMSSRRRLFSPGDPRREPENWPGPMPGHKVRVANGSEYRGVVNQDTGEVSWHPVSKTGEVADYSVSDPGYGQMWDEQGNPVADVAASDYFRYADSSVEAQARRGEESARRSIQSENQRALMSGSASFMDGRTPIPLRARMGQAIGKIGPTALRGKKFFGLDGQEYTFKMSSTDPSEAQYSFESGGSADTPASVMFGPQDIHTAVGIAQGAATQAMQGPMPQEGTAATATFAQRFQKYAKEQIDKFEKQVFAETGDEAEARSTGQRVRKLVDTIKGHIVDAAGEELTAEFGGDKRAGKHLQPSRLTRDAALKRYNESAEIREQVGNQPIENILASGESFVVTEGNKAFDIGNQPWDGPGVEPRDRKSSNGMWGGKIGAALYGAYLLQREWKMALGQPMAEAERYGAYASEMGRFALPDGVRAASTDAGFTAREEIGARAMGRGAYQVLGAFMNTPYLMSGYGDAPARMQTMGGLGFGIGASTVLGANMLSMMELLPKAAVGPVGWAGVAAGVGVIGAGLGMEAYNRYVAEPGEEVTLSKIVGGGQKLGVMGRAMFGTLREGWDQQAGSNILGGAFGQALFGGLSGPQGQKVGSKLLGDIAAASSLPNAMLRVALGDKSVFQDGLSFTDPEKDILSMTGSTPEVDKLIKEAQGIQAITGEDQASTQQAARMLKSMTGQDENYDLLRKIAIAARDSGVGTYELESQAGQYATNLGLLKGTSEFGSAIDQFTSFNPGYVRELAEFRSQRVAALGGQLQALMGGEAEFYGQGAQMVQRFGLNNQARVGAVAGAIGSFQQMGADLSMGQMNQIGQYMSTVNPYVGQTITQATQIAQVAGMSTSGAMSMGFMLSDAGMTNQQAFTYDRALGGDMRALSYQAWENGTYANRMYDQSGNAIWETNGNMAMKWFESNMANLGGIPGKDGFSSLPGFSKFTGLSGRDLASAVTGSSNSKILDAFMQHGTRGIELLARRDSAQAQLASAGIQLKGIELQENYLWGDDSGGTWDNPTSGSMWGLEDRSRDMQHGFQMAAFGEQQTRMTLSNQFSVQRENNQWQRMQVTNAYNAAQWSQQYNQFQQQQGWAREDWQYQDTMRGLQFGWQMEDMNESIRFASGRERKQLLRQRDRSALTQNLEEQNVETQRDRQEQMWSQEDERYRKQREYQVNLQRLDTESFETNKKQRETFYKLDQESFARKMKEYEEERKLQEEITELQRKYQYDQIQLQKESAQVSAGAAAAQIEYSNALLETTQTLGNAKGFAEQINSYDMAYRVMNATTEMLKAADGVSTTRIDKIIMLLKTLKNTDVRHGGEVD